MSYARPKTLREALNLRREHPSHVVLAGGTDLMVRAPEHAMPEGAIDVFDLREMRYIKREDGALVIGAATTYADLLRSDDVRVELPMLWESAREIGALQIQERGTVGGNIGTSSPVGDTLPVWLALEAEIELASAARGHRVVPYDRFCVGYRKTVLEKDELVVAVKVPLPGHGSLQLWRKIGTRRAQSISKTMVACATRFDGGRFERPRIGLGAVADRPVRAPRVEDALQGEKPGKDLEERVRSIVREDVKPIDDVRSTAAYRLHVVENVLGRVAREGAAAFRT